LLREIKEEVHIPYDILVVNNDSTDTTKEIALNHGCKVLDVPTPGKGNAIRSSLKAITTPYTVMMNSDWTYPARFVTAIYNRLLKGADVVMGSRLLVDKGAMTLGHTLGNLGLSTLASVLYHRDVVDLCTGMWGFKTPILQSFELTSTHFTLEADLFVNCVKRKVVLVDQPIAYRARVDGDRPKLRTMDGMKIGWFLLRKRFNG